MRHLKGFRPGRARGTSSRARAWLLLASALAIFGVVSQVAPALALSTNATTAKSSSTASAGGSCTQTGNESASTNQANYTAGSTVRVSGSGFDTSCDVTVQVTKPDGSTDSSPASTDLSGSFASDYALASDAATGTYGVDVLDDNNQVLAHTTFSVVAATGAPCAPLGTESIGFDQSSYSPGDTVDASGLGFSIACDVTIKVTQPDGTAGSDTVTTSLSGTFDYGYSQDSQTGTYQVAVLGANDAVLASGQFSVVSNSQATLTTDKPYYFTGEKVTFTGSNFAPGESVSILVQGSGVADRTETATADSSGNFTNEDLVMQPSDNGVDLTATATGDTSGKTASATFSDANPFYFSITTGNWGSNTTWKTCTDSAGTTGCVSPAASAPTASNSSGFTIESGNTVTVAATITAGAPVTVNSGGDLEISSGQTFSIAHTATPDLLDNGTVGVTGTLTQQTGSTGSYAEVGSTGTLEVKNGGLINGVGGNAATRSTLTVDSGGQWTIDSGGSLNATGSGGMQLTVNSGGTATLNGPVSMGTTAIATTFNGTVTASANITIGSVSDLEVGGTLTMTGGTITVAKGSGGTTGNINSGGTIALQNSAVLAITTTGTATFHVASGGTLDMGPSALVNGAGFLTVDSGGNLKIGSTAGITSTTSSGNVQTSGTDSYSTSANYTYDGTAAQSTGNALPATVNNLTVNNSGPANVSLTGSVTVGGALALTSGDLATGANNVTEGASATTSGTTDVVGNFIRTTPGTAALTYGNPNNVIQATATAPTSITVNLAKSAPSGDSGAVKRTYTITPSGGSGYTASLQLHYLDSELNSNTESSLSLWRSATVSGTFTDQGESSRDTTNNWAKQTGVTAANLSGVWTLANTTADSTPPTSTITFPANTGNYNSSGWGGSITGTAADNSGGSGVKQVDVQVVDNTASTHWNGSSFVSGTSGFVTATGTTSWSLSLASSNLTSGDSYTVTSKATDNANNVESSPPTASFKYDTAAPSSSISFPTATTYSTSSWTSGGAAVTGSASDSGGSGLASVGVSIKDNATGKWFDGSGFNANSEQFNAASGTSSWSYAIASSKFTSGDTYTVRSKATDNASNAQSTPDSVTFTFQDDTTPPTSTITFPVDGSSYNASGWTGSITGAADDNAGGSGVQKVDVQVVDNTASTHWNGSSFVSGTSGFVTATGTTSWSLSLASSNLTSGDSYTVTSKATDNASNVESSPPTASFEYDTAAPSSTITFPADGSSYNAAGWDAGCTTTGVCGTASDTGGSGLAFVGVRIHDTTNDTYWDGSGWSGTSSSFNATSTTDSYAHWSYAFAHTNLTNGHSYTVTSRAIDNAVNVETPGSADNTHSFTYDTSAPTVTIVSTTPGTINGSGSSTVKWNATEAGTFNVRLGSDCSSGHSFDSGSYTSGDHSSTIDAASLSEGSNTIVVCVTDAATNTGSNTTTVTKDTTPPNVPTLSAPADASTSNNASPTLQWSDETASGATNYDVQFTTKSGPCDFTGVTPDNVSTNSQAKSGLADGTYCWRVRSVDAYSNASDYSSTFTFTVDTTPPNVPTLSAPANNANISSNPTFTWSDESTSGAVKYDLQYVLKGGSCDFTGATTVSDIAGTTYTPSPAIADGTYCWRVRSTDAVGNKSSYASPFTFTKSAADTDGDGIPNTVDCNPSQYDNLVVDPNNVTGLTLGVRRFNTLQAAVNAAQDNYVISMYANTTENVVINNGKDLEIEGCGHKIAAANGSLPTIDVQSGAGDGTSGNGSFTADIQIQDLTVNGGSVGIKVQTSKSGRNVWALLKGFRADNNKVGVQITGDGNEVSGANSISSNGQSGVVVSGNNNYVHDSRIFSNGQMGILATSSNNRFNKNKVGDDGGNGQDGINVTGNGNTINENDVFSSGRDGIYVAGNTNTINKNDVGDQGKGNGRDGISINGNSNTAGSNLNENDVFANGRDGFLVVGNLNVLAKNASGDRNKGNGRDGFDVSGYGNQLTQNTAYSNGRDGFDIAGGTVASPNVLVQNTSGDVGKGNGRNGFTLADKGNGTANPIELVQNTAQGNTKDGINVSGTGWQLQNNVSGGSSGQKNGNCAYNVVAGNFNATGNKANNNLIPGALNSAFPTGCTN